ncbi:MAG: DUF1295 domain-containing protein [Eubacteriales bacterium]|nr:DUF1295 domain-containing protein [Eubacteriales bacterium]
MNLKKNRSMGLVIITLIYSVAIWTALLVNQQMAAYSLLYRVFWADVAATVFVYLAGVWKYARHPNYLAEIIFWWGIYLFLVSVRPRLWLLGFGALLNTLMFLFISIPMAEKRLAREKDGYEEYAARTRMLLPIKKSS